MAQIGCLITCIADLSTYFHPARLPSDIVAKASFTAQGLVIWSSLKLVGFQFYLRDHVRNDARIQQHIKHPDLAVALQVANATHWVVGTGLPFFGALYKIADPLFGDFSTMKRYQDSVTGAAYFKRI